MTTEILAGRPAFWNIVSLVLPAGAVLIGVIALLTRGSSGFGGGLGNLFKATILCGGVGVFGEAAAISALVRGERMAWLSVLGLLANGAIILPAILLLSRMDWD